jgi:hypothetical protein
MMLLENRILLIVGVMVVMVVVEGQVMVVAVGEERSHCRKYTQHRVAAEEVFLFNQMIM